MDRNIWVISDTHFGHANIIQYCKRPFSTAKEMDEAIIDNWNSVVKEQDIVYHLGDVYFGIEGSKALHKLNGRKRLILGNHDVGKDPLLHGVFQKISVWRMFPEFGLLLTHVPVHYSSLERTEGEEEPRLLTNVHGHIHEKQSPMGRYINVSVEQINYTPVNIESLRVK